MLLLLILIDIKTLLVNDLSAIPIKRNQAFSNGTKSLPNNNPDCPFSWN